MYKLLPDSLYKVPAIENWVLPTARRGIGTIPANLFIILWFNGMLYHDWRALGRLRQSLAAGIPMEHRGPYGARRRAQRVYILVAVSLLAVSLVEVNRAQTYFRELPAGVPAVALEDLGTIDIRYRGGWVLYMTAEAPETLTDHLDALDEALSRPMRKGDA